MRVNTLESRRQVNCPLGSKRYDKALFGKLLQLRREVANALHVPEHMIFQYQSLLDMAQRKPTDSPALHKIWGVSNWRLDKYGFAFLAIIQAHKEGSQ